MTRPVMNLEKYYEVLNAHGIQPTPLRILVLEYIMKYSKATFTIDEVNKAVKEELDTASVSAITSTLILFRIRGLISEMKASSFMKEDLTKRGRPVTKWSLTIKKIDQ